MFKQIALKKAAFLIIITLILCLIKTTSEVICDHNFMAILLSFVKLIYDVW